MSTEKLYHIKMLYKRKEGMSAEEFSRYWVQHHSKITKPFHQRYGVVKYNQVSRIHPSLFAPFPRNISVLPITPSLPRATWLLAGTR
jgi:hypothetical protein